MAFLPDSNPEWEISFYQSLEDIGGMLLLQGGSSTLIAGLIALGYNKPILPCSGFGGTTAKLSSIMPEKGMITAPEKALLQTRPDATSMPSWAENCVKLLLKQSSDIEAKRQEQPRAAESARHRRTIHFVTAAALAVVTLLLCILDWDNALRFSPSGVRAIIHT